MQPGSAVRHRILRGERELERPDREKLVREIAEQRTGALVVPVALLTLFAVGFFLVLIGLAQERLNAEADAAAKHVAGAAIGRELRTLDDLTVDYSHWNDAVLNVVVTPSPEWIDANLGSSLAEYQSIDQSYVLTSGDALIAGFVDGRQVDTAPDWLFGAALQALLGSSRRASELEGPAPVPASRSGFIAVGDELLMVSVAAFTPDEPIAGFEAYAGAALVVVRRVDGEILSRLERDFLMSGLMAVPLDRQFSAGSSTLVLRDPVGVPAARLVWQRPAPGDRILQRYGLYVISGLCLIIVLTIWFTRRVKRANDLRETLIGELQVERDVAAAADRSKSEFLACMSHELRTPLNSISGMTEMVQQEIFGPIPDKAKEYLGDVQTASTHLLDLINDILDISRIEAGEMKLEEETVDLVPIVRAVTALMTPRARKERIKIVISIPDPLPLLLADPRKVKQMLLNLVSNAVKFTPPGGSVEIAAGNLPSGELALSVTDTGRGIPPEDRKRIFEPFQRLDDMMTRRREGTGLGLPITKAQAELHGGRIDLDSEVGRGSTFTIRFPVQRIVRAESISPFTAAVAERA